MTAGTEILKGYKLTEVGVIPEDWEVKSAHELAALRTGPFGTLLKASEYSETDGVPVISVSEIRKGFLRITENTPRVSDAVIRRLPQYLVRKGDIVFGRKGGVVIEVPIQRGARVPLDDMPDGIEILSGLRAGDEILPVERAS